jgi:uncharacterized membrane protein YkoI
VSGINEKAVLRVNADGDVLSCAKGAAESCGWTAGDKVCGKCGAMAVMTKGNMDPSRAAHHMGKPGAHDTEDADFGVGMEREADEEVYDEDQAMTRKPSARNMKPAETEDVLEEDGLPEEDSEDSEDELQRQAKIKKYRKMRLGGMGVKDATGDEGTFLCGMSRKMHPNGSEPCDGCPGGCYPVHGMFDLLAVEGKAMAEFGGKVLDSGYSSQYDTFVVDVERKDGRIIEAYYDGSGAAEGWHPLPEDAVSYNAEIISGEDAMLTAVGHIPGQSLGLKVLVVDDDPAYRVEVHGDDGFSYDVFVGMDGKVLGVDQYEYEVKAEATDDITAALMEFEALSTEAELRDQGLI